MNQGNLTCCVLQLGSWSCLKKSSMDTKRVLCTSSSTSDSSDKVGGGPRRLVSCRLRRSKVGALGGVGMCSGVSSLAQGSSMNSVIDGKGHMVPGLSVSLLCSNTAADGVTDNCVRAAEGSGAAAGTMAGRSAEAIGEVTLTWRWDNMKVIFFIIQEYNFSEIF